MANRIVQTDYAPAAIGPYSQGAFTQIALYCSGQLGIDPATGKLADGIEEQATQAFKNLRAVITEAVSHDGRYRQSNDLPYRHGQFRRRQQSHENLCAGAVPCPLLLCRGGAPEGRPR
ncbi:putative uncharacterized protein [Sutterella wadsworthensis CAG:135]|nr:putative uncharacterized protein [Sutterella wadsworthensis CAG:135]